MNYGFLIKYITNVTLYEGDNKSDIIREGNVG